jgi:hypothetical protein
MHRIVWLKRALSEAHDALGSTSCTELAQISILCIIGMIASMLVIASSDRTFAAVYGLCTRIMACNERDRFRVTPASRLFCRSRSARAPRRLSIFGLRYRQRLVFSGLERLPTPDRLRQSRERHRCRRVPSKKKAHLFKARPRGDRTSADRGPIDDCRKAKSGWFGRAASRGIPAGLMPETLRLMQYFGNCFAVEKRLRLLQPLKVGI